LIAIIFIFFCVTAGWVILGGTVQMRTESGYDPGPAGGRTMGQRADTTYPRHRDLAGVGGRRVAAQFQPRRGGPATGARRKGLLWYSTYAVRFDGAYTIENTLSHPVTATVTYTFPGSNAIYDDFEFRVGDVQATPVAAARANWPSRCTWSPASR
jgi:hypothetical protein